MSSPNPELINIAPFDQWYTDNNGTIAMHHPYERGPELTGVDYHLDINTHPLDFKRNVDWSDGMEAMDGAVERSLKEGKQFEVSVLLTDPSRPDSLTSELSYAVSEFKMIFHSEVRSVFHAGRADKFGYLPGAGGSMLGLDGANPEYRSKLKGILTENFQENGIPHFSFGPFITDKDPNRYFAADDDYPQFDPDRPDPSPALSLAHTVQALRTIAYVEASKQEDMDDPDLEFFVPDMAHVSSLQSLQLGISGLKMQEYADDPRSGMNGILPEKVLYIMPVEHGAFVGKLEQTLGPARVNAGLALPDMRSGEYVVDQVTLGYDIGLRTARLHPTIEDPDLPFGHSMADVPYYYGSEER